MKYFDKINDRLVFTGKVASPDYWDQQWDVENFEKIVRNGKNNRLIMQATKKFIHPDKTKKILEGGCGNGQFVYAFDELGYDSYGVDYAEKTITKIKSIFPKLQVTTGDVRKLDFPDNYFDGYWSIGVIEHFYDGYDSIIKEMQRVLRPGGFLFISFPHLSPLRRLKALLGFYPSFDAKDFNQKEFYQFALNQNTVIERLDKAGFTLLQKTPYSGTKGLKDEVSFLKPLLQKIYDSHNLMVRIINYCLSLSLSCFSSHAILLIFRKK